MVQPISSDRWADVTDDWRAVFEATYSSAASPTQERIWRAVFGDAYPDGVDPYSFVSRMELTRFAGEVQVGPGNALVDVGCGRGGAGLWVSAATGAELIGDRHRRDGDPCRAGAGRGDGQGRDLPAR